MMSGPLRSILLPPIIAVVQLPAASQTIWLFVLALAFSVPAATDVDSENEAAPGFASPLPLSLAVHANVTFSACHAPSGEGQRTLGAIVSSGGLLPFVPASMHVWIACGRFEKKLYPVKASTASTFVRKFSQESFLMPCVFGMMTAMVREEQLTREMSSSPLGITNATFHVYAGTVTWPLATVIVTPPLLPAPPAPTPPATM